MTLKKFNRLQENSQAHTVFKLDWNAYAALDFADTFLPDVKAYKGKAVYFMMAQSCSILSKERLLKVSI